jgi:osmotically-inducible protein OsmY
VLFGAVGLAIGLLIAPVPGRELRRKLLELVSAGRAPDDADLIDKVTFELSHAPRTWHLEPQPEVAVVAGRVILTGEARDDSAADEFVRVAAAIPGVVEVDNRLVVVGSEA